MCSRIKRQYNIAQMFVLTKAIYRFNIIPFKDSMIFVRNRNNPEIHTEFQGALNCQKILKKDEGRPHTSWIQTYYKATVRHRHKDRHIDQWNRTENSEINLYVYGQMILKRMLRLHNEERRVSSTNGA